jgi:aspartyl-tRNA(Asn)/glutamyl-tRNA(Gln) amidotransferase subunit A
VRRLLRNDYDKAFKKCDLIIGPTSSGTAFEFGGKSHTPLEMYLNDLYTVALNLNGSCGLSIPVGFDSCGLPVGMQLQGDMFAEEKLLSIAHTFQKHTDYHKQIAGVK